MKKFRNLFEQHREKGRFRPTRPHNVSNILVASPRMSEELDKPTPSVEEIASKHNVSVDFVKKQLETGIKVEKEHTSDEKTAREIALDHLKEKPNYYMKLKKYVEDIELEEIKEDLRKWFDPKHPEGGWKRINSKGEAIGPCAREPGEAKPKCMSNEKRAKLTKKERAAAVSAKRRHDPNPERKGEPINVSNFGKGKISEEIDVLDEENKPTNPELWARAKALAKSKFDVYPSAYANGWASKWYKSKGGGWKSVSEEIELEELKEMDKSAPQPGRDGRVSHSTYGTRDEKGSDYFKGKEAPGKAITAKQAEKDALEILKKQGVAEAAKWRSDDLEGKTWRSPDWDDGDLSPSKIKIDRSGKDVDDSGDELTSRPGAWRGKADMAKRMTKKGVPTKSELAFQNNLKMRMRMKKKEGGLTGPKGALPEQSVAEEIENLEEGRPSQRHPLAGHDYHKKSDDELRYIVKDAGEAARNLRGHASENKYADQVNDASTVLHFRKTSGTPNWYKKKYGHMKEAKDEREYDYEGDMLKSDLRSIIANANRLIDMIEDNDNLPEWCQTKITLAEDYVSTVANYLTAEMNEEVKKDEEPPFEPGPKVKPSKPGKYGAGYSTARNIARRALQKQVQKMKPVKESLQESRKAEIVKEIMKKKKNENAGSDKYQSEPVLSNEIMKENK